MTINQIESAAIALLKRTDISHVEVVPVGDLYCVVSHDGEETAICHEIRTSQHAAQMEANLLEHTASFRRKRSL